MKAKKFLIGAIAVYRVFKDFINLTVCGINEKEVPTVMYFILKAMLKRGAILIKLDGNKAKFMRVKPEDFLTLQSYKDEFVELDIIIKSIVDSTKITKKILKNNVAKGRFKTDKKFEKMGLKSMSFSEAAQFSCPF